MVELFGAEAHRWCKSFLPGTCHRSVRFATPNAKLSPIWPSTDNGCSVIVRRDPPISTLAPSALADLAVSRKDSPEQRSASCHADIDAKAPDRASVGISLVRRARYENTSHILKRAEDQPDSGVGVACQAADSKRGARLRRCRAEKNGQEYTYDRRRTNAGHRRRCQQTRTTDCGDGPKSETARRVLSSAINPHDGVLTGIAKGTAQKATCQIMPMSCARVDRKKPWLARMNTPIDRQGDLNLDERWFDAPRYKGAG